MTVMIDKPAAAAAPAARLASIDIVRGVVMVLMAIDHVRVYAGVPAGGASAGLFLTRWVTHFCAPVFVFLAGTSAYLYGRRVPRAALTTYLVTRGALLILLEFTLIRASWTFSVDYSQFILAGVIWMLGVCMVLMGALVWLPTPVIGALGLAVIAGQDLLNALPARPVFDLLYLANPIPLREGGPAVTVLYTIVPWIGVMAAGYAFGAIMTLDAPRRRSLCLRIGLGATLAFIVLAAVPVFSASAAANAPPAWIRLLNQRKYPASALFLLMTLGPAVAILPLVEGARGRAGRMFALFGRVPMFYYLLHIPVIHAVSLLVWKIRDGVWHHDWFLTAPYVFVPPGQRWGLGLLYLVFAISIALLYPPCRWYAARKRHGSRWLRYL